MQRYRAVATHGVGLGVCRLISAVSIFYPMPRVAVAVVLLVGACVLVADGQVQGHNAVAPCSIAACDGVRCCGVGFCVLCAVYPGVGVAVVLLVGACVLVADGQVQRYDAVAVCGIGQSVGSSRVGRGVFCAVYPRVGVAVVLDIGACVAVADGQVQSYDAVTVCCIRQRVGSSAVG